MRRLSNHQFKFLDGRAVQAVQNDKGEIFIQMSGVMNSTKISYAIAKVVATGVADEAKYIPSLEEFVDDQK